MANLTSPGVQVSVTDESVYGPAGAGTVPMLFIATGEDKADPTLTETDGIAKYTKSAQSKKPILVTSQRELTQYFGNIDFRKVSGTVQQGDETNEYGLLAAYSFLGQSSAAYIVRADVNLTELRPSSSAPAGNPANNTYWVNPTGASWGIYESESSAWVEQTPTVEIVTSGAPTTAAGTAGDYLVLITNGTSNTTISYFKSDGSTWVALADGDTTFAPHYSDPTGHGAGKVWIKTTAKTGLKLTPSLFTTTAGSFVNKSVTYSQDSDPAGTTSDVHADGSGAGSARTLADGDLWFDFDDATSSIELKRM